MQWRCEWCGRTYDADDPPCDTCGHESFEPADGSESPFDSGATVWVCADCGCEHVKNSPPCSRCGGHNLEQREAGAEDIDEELIAPGYLDVGKPYLLGIAAVVVIVGLALAGVIPIPGVSGPPAPPEAPGDSDRANGLELSAVERSVHDRLTEERAEAGTAERGYDDGGGLDAFIEYATSHRVAEEYDPDYDGDPPDPADFDLACGSAPTLGVVNTGLDVSEYDSETALGNAVAESMLSEESFREVAVGEQEREAIAIHVAPDGAVYVGYIAC